MDKVVCTPHIGNITCAQYEPQFADIFALAVAYARANPVNVVNPKVLTVTTASGPATST